MGFITSFDSNVTNFYDKIAVVDSNGTGKIIYKQLTGRKLIFTEANAFVMNISFISGLLKSFIFND